MNKIILATGADIKNRLLLAKGRQLYFGKDLTDLAKIESFELFQKQIYRFCKIAPPKIITCDLHPDYFSSRFARELSLKLKACSLRVVQHHHAHIASVVFEHRLKLPVLGVSFDGTGYGLDGNFWGGEFLLVNGRDFFRLGHFKYRKMPGAEQVVYQPWRMVLSILGQQAIPFLKPIPQQQQLMILKMIEQNVHSPQSSSVARLFDAVAALLGVCLRATYEAQGPIQLEALCEPGIASYYGFDIIKEGTGLVIDTENVFLEILQDIKRRKDKGLIAAKFHNSIAEIIVRLAKRFSTASGIKDIVLSGGVFQNNFLRCRVVKRLSAIGLNPFTNIKTPLNDLNISLGQYYVSGYTGKN